MNFKSKSILFALFFCCAFSLNPLNAQQGGKKMTAKERAAKQTEMMTEELKLSDTQAAQVAVINLKYTERAEALRTNSKDRTENRAAMETLRSEQNTELKSILTEEQMTQLENMPKARRGGKGRRNG